MEGPVVTEASPVVSSDPRNSAIKRTLREIEESAKKKFSDTDEMQVWLCATGALEPAVSSMIEGLLDDACKASSEEDRQAIDRVTTQFGLNKSYATHRVGACVASCLKHLLLTKQLDSMPGNAKPAPVTKKAKTDTKK